MREREGILVAMKRPMPIGIEDFKEIVTGNYCFIDKTRFIKEFLDGQGKVTLITRPRRFGKTLALSMLRYFFTVEHAETLYMMMLTTGYLKSVATHWNPEGEELAYCELLIPNREKVCLTEFSRQGVEETWKYGIAFHGKRVWLEKG